MNNMQAGTLSFRSTTVVSNKQHAITLKAALLRHKLVCWSVLSSKNCSAPEKKVTHLQVLPEVSVLHVLPSEAHRAAPPKLTVVFIFLHHKQQAVNHKVLQSVQLNSNPEFAAMLTLASV